MKKNIKIIMAFVLGLIISGIGVYAVTQIAATTVTYDNTTSGLNATDAQAALDELNEKVNGIGKIFVVYSAAGDTLYYYDSNNNKVDFCLTNNSGKAICTAPKNGNVTIYSSIAKDPNNISNPYSKTINISNNMEEVYMMPDNTLYWYGYNNGTIVGYNSANGYSYGGWTIASASFRTNDIYISSSGSLVMYGAATSGMLSSGSTVNVVSGSNTRAYYYVYGSKNGSNLVTYGALSSNGKTSFTLSSNSYVVLTATGGERNQNPAFAIDLFAVYLT